MGEALIIAIIGQVATILVVLIQQIFNNRNLKHQRKSELEKMYYNNKCEAYKRMLSLLSGTTVNKYLDIGYDYIGLFYKDVVVYLSDELTEKFNLFEKKFVEILELKYIDKNHPNLESKMEELGFIAGQIHAIVRRELKEF